MSAFIAFVGTRLDALLMRIAEHLLLTGIATLAALVLGIALAIMAFHYKKLRGPILLVVNLLQTIPGMALLVIMLVLLGTIGMLPALAALLLYALLPIVRNTLTGLLGLPPTLAEAALALGMTPWQRLRHVRIPHAMPMIIAGLRTAAVQCVGLATLAAFVGAGGLGQLINRGLFLSDTRLILLGAVPAAIIAMAIDGLISLLQYGAFTTDAPRPKRRASLLAGSVLMAGMLAFTLAYAPNLQFFRGEDERIVIGSKVFTEQYIVAEIVAQLIERDTDIEVVRRLGLGGTSVLHEAMRQGDLDLIVEYTGTALTAVLGRRSLPDPAQVYAEVRDAFATEFDQRWFAPLGFNNTYVLALRGDDRRFRGIGTLSKLAHAAPRMRAAFDFDFAERPDGYAGLKKTYGMQFAQVRDMHPDLMYDALARGDTDVICVYATDGRLAQHDFTLLRDDKHFFPPYEAAVVLREAALTKHPELEGVLATLSGAFTDETMRKLNEAVDRDNRTPAEVARAFLAQLPPAAR
jgi:osmoprotectant transport system permease protein